MPAYPRHEIVADDEMGIYHCIARCVRRAFLCGVDPVTGKNNDHRKEWIRARLEQLASFFAVEVCGYAVLSNWAADGQALQRGALGNLSWKRSLARPAVEFPNSPDYPYFVPGRLQACVTSGDSTSIRVVPVVYTFARARELEAQGQKRDKDFVQYFQFPMANRVQTTVLLMVKTRF